MRKKPATLYPKKKQQVNKDLLCLLLSLTIFLSILFLVIALSSHWAMVESGMLRNFLNGGV